nr:uncharacterized protein C6orf226 homolog [Salarias fasciatus]
MESVFLRFDSYDFEADQRFVEGLKSFNKPESRREEILDLKLYFYNRFVEPIDRSGYKQQKSSSAGVAEQLEQRTPSLSGLDVSETPTEEASAQTEQLSFAEVMRLIQEGKEVPGVTKLDVQPSNQSPTPSRMTRILKPWETA